MPVPRSSVSGWFEAAATTALGFLAAVLAQERGGGGRVTWLVPEE